jgi:hypothetical protein
VGAADYIYIYLSKFNSTLSLSLSQCIYLSKFSGAGALERPLYKCLQAAPFIAQFIQHSKLFLVVSDTHIL